MQKKRLIMAVALAMVLGLAGLLSAAQVFNVDVPLTFVLPDTCSGESVFFTGNAHFTLNVTVADSGNFRIAFHANSQGISGVGNDSGIKYQLPAALNANLNVKGTSAGAEVNVILNSGLISQGKTDNEQISFALHVTVDANGNVTSFKFEPISITCRGAV